MRTTLRYPRLHTPVTMTLSIGHALCSICRLDRLQTAAPSASLSNRLTFTALSDLLGVIVTCLYKFELNKTFKNIVFEIDNGVVQKYVHML